MSVDFEQAAAEAWFGGSVPDYQAALAAGRELLAKQTTKQWKADMRRFIDNATLGYLSACDADDWIYPCELYRIAETLLFGGPMTPLSKRGKPRRVSDLITVYGRARGAGQPPRRRRSGATKSVI